MKPLDAMHLASFKRLIAAAKDKGVGVTEFHTYDEVLFKYEELAGFKICPPHREAGPLFT